MAAMPERERPLPTERGLLRLSLGSPGGFLILRVLLAVILFFQILTLRGAGQRPFWAAGVIGAYAAAAALAYFLTVRGRLADDWAAGTFLIDGAAALAILRLVEGPAGADSFTALLLLIMGSCLLGRPLLILAVALAGSLAYGALAFPTFPDAFPTFLLRLSMFLLVALFGVHVADYAARVERRTASRYEDRLAWMQRLSLVGRGRAAVLHEAKTPLGAIVLNSESAMRAAGEGRDPTAELKEIAEQAQHAHLILQNFLDFVKPAELERADLFLKDPLLQAAAMARVRLEERGVRLALEAREDCRVRGSARHLTQCFSNVINNAVDAMPEGGSLSIRMEREGGRARVVFADTGVGMTPVRLAGLFEPFSTSKAAEEGHGLGLGIVRWIMQEHGGEVSVRSPGPGKGAVVVLELPVI